MEAIKSIVHFSFSDIFGHPSQWPIQAFDAACVFVIHHPHVVHIVSFSVFFGPIITLLPLLLIHELVIALLFNLTFLTHGLIPGSADAHYSYLRKILLNARETVFAYVDSTGSTYNKWTMDYAPLAVLRLAALALGCYALYEIRGLQ
ncbi:hypothetical protein BDZ94DRAFT_1254258 [Collybia nuda]|uniref:Uncharacterized protein n=1 Tax=Collybia nuda TaxID=64659 RepID=A0A9P6CGJ0_9AGAR|nr:hypothetical protein BDZ94DRAFT_1254258 [Collybia nuda]